MSNLSRLSRRHFLKLSAATAAVGAAGTAAWLVPAQPREIFTPPPSRKLFLYNTHTNESLATPYWVDGAYDKKGLQGFNRLLRDHRSGDVTRIDPHLFDLLFKLQARLKHFSWIEVVSGYRSPATNRWLASFHSGVAKHSFHIHGKA